MTKKLLPLAELTPWDDVILVSFFFFNDHHEMSDRSLDRSGFDGPWTFSPVTFSNQYFALLRDEPWQWKKWWVLYYITGNGQWPYPSITGPDLPSSKTRRQRPWWCFRKLRPESADTPNWPWCWPIYTVRIWRSLKTNPSRSTLTFMPITKRSSLASECLVVIKRLLAVADPTIASRKHSPSSLSLVSLRGNGLGNLGLWQPAINFGIRTIVTRVNTW